MSNAVLTKIEEIFGNPEKFTPENLEALINETLKFFNDLRQKLESPDAKVREDALAVATELKTKLEEQAAALCQSVGLDQQALESFISNPTHFSPEEWKAMEKAKTELSGYQEEIAKTEASAPKKPKKKKVTERLMG